MRGSYVTIWSHVKHEFDLATRAYASGDVRTQAVDGFCGNVKNEIAGNHHGVSAKWLQSYVDEYVWAYNHEGDDRSILAALPRTVATS
jgi:transposase